MKYFLTLTAAAVLASCNNQPPAAGGSSNNIAQLEQLYKKSYDLKDVPTAITAVQMILVQDSTHYLRDSLPSMYLVMQNVEACLVTTEDALLRKPGDEELLKYKLLCLEDKGEEVKMKALASELYEKTGKAEYIYKMASYQLLEKKFDLAAKTITEIEQKFKDSNDSISMAMNQTMTQKVPVLAVAAYIRAYLYIQKQQYEPALASYEKAMKIFPDFVMAQRDYQQLIQGLGLQKGGK